MWFCSTFSFVWSDRFTVIRLSFLLFIYLYTFIESDSRYLLVFGFFYMFIVFVLFFCFGFAQWFSSFEYDQCSNVHEYYLWPDGRCSQSVKVCIENKNRSDELQPKCQHRAFVLQLAQSFTYFIDNFESLTLFCPIIIYFHGSITVAFVLLFGTAVCKSIVIGKNTQVAQPFERWENFDKTNCKILQSIFYVQTKCLSWT